MKGARLGATWGPRRPVTVDGEARRIAALLEAIAAAHPGLGRWVFQDLEERLQPCTLDAIAGELRAHQGTEQDRVVGTVRGMAAVCRARGRFDDVAELRVTVVDHDGPADAWTPSRVVLTVDVEASPSAIRQMLDALVRITDPWWAFADAGGGPLGGDRSGVPHVGWATWLHRHHGRPRTAVEGVEVVVRHGGRLVQLEKDPPADPAALAVKVEAIRVALKADGVLRPYREVIADPRDLEPDERGVPVAAPAAPARAPDPMPAPPEVRAPARVVPLADVLQETQPARPSTGPEVLPFQDGASRADAPAPTARDELGATRELGQTRELGTTAPARPGPATSRALPFASPGATPAAAGGLTVEQYASLCAWLEVEPQSRASLLARHHVASEEQLTTLEAEFARRFEADPALHGRWAGLVMRYREAFARFPGAHGPGPGR